MTHHQEHIILDSNKTILNDRELWYDGDSVVPHESIANLVSLGISTSGLFVDKITPEIKQYNSLVNDEDKIKTKKELATLSYQWNIPEQYQQLDINKYIVDCLEKEFQTTVFSEPQQMLRTKRVVKELALYEKLGLTDVLRTLIYVINTLRDNKIVWGVGRGSSVSSYVLYLIGVHDVDSVKYELQVEDFLRLE